MKKCPCCKNENCNECKIDKFSNTWLCCDTHNHLIEIKSRCTCCNEYSNMYNKCACRWTHSGICTTHHRDKVVKNIDIYVQKNKNEVNELLNKLWGKK